MSSCHLIYNPVAGKGRVADALARARARLAHHGLSPSEFVTAGPGEARVHAAGLPANALVLAMGGDGTVQEVASACVGTERVLGVLPTGSGDDFAFALGIDRHDLEAAVDRAVCASTRLVDSGLANGRRFINAAGTGFDAEVAFAALTAPGFLRERNAYLYGIFRSLTRLASVDCRVELDGVLVHQGPALLVSAQNGPRSGGAFPLAPGARNDDGLLDVLVAGGFSRAATVGILPRVFVGNHLRHPRVSLFRGRSLSISWQQPRPAHLEGELLAPRGDYEIVLEPRSLSVAG